MITLMLMFLACENNKAETTKTTDNTTTEQVETTVTPKTTKVDGTPVNADSKKLGVTTADNKSETTNSTNAGDNNATND